MTELAWTRELPTVDADYLCRLKVGERGAYVYRALRVKGDTFRLYSESLPGLEGVVRSFSDLKEGCEFLGPLPE